MKNLKKNGGITLVALVITIVILLILAAISIQALTNQGIFAQAENAKNLTEQKTAEESATLRDYEEQIGIAIGDPNYTAATTIAEAQTDDMLAKKVNSSMVDAYGNKITVPAGFKIKVDDTTNNATTVDKGIVIIDSNGNEFVWIPVGRIYTDAEKTEANAKTINLNRYTFDSNGNPTAQNDAVVETYYQELATSTLGNTTAKDINDFKTKASATGSGGFYIGRYEARQNSSGAITEKGTDSVWFDITQPNAATQARNMYKDSTKFTSDLMNSYAWDTATLFLQTCGTNSKYSRQTRISSTFAITGTNDTTQYAGIQDIQCNVYDMASNVKEWTTETSSISGSPCGSRGAGSAVSGHFVCGRCCYSTSDTRKWYHGFRPILYVNV